MHALSISLDGMVERGELELDPDRKEALLVELVTAGSDARSVKHMLKKITSTLVDSDPAANAGTAARARTTMIADSSRALRFTLDPPSKRNTELPGA